MKIRQFNFLLWLALAGFWSSVPQGGMANPTGLTVGGGTATTVQTGPRLTITTSQNANLNWQSFNIAAGETTIFNQPSITSVVWNHINDPNPSQIFGSLQANGIVVLMNSSGFYFGPNSYVKTGGLIISTANCVPPQNTGGSWQFNGPPPLSSIVNFGKIDITHGGSAYLIAENVFNHGSINAPGGEVGLAAGQHVVLSERPDGRGLSMQVNLPDGSVDNYGHITADAGTIAMNARSVNQDGLVQANSVREEHGVIELFASDNLSLGANSQIVANGDNSTGGSSGGSVTLRSGNTFSDAVGSQIDVIGGSQGGNGGNVEISAPDILSLNSVIDAGALSGWDAGVFVLDPQNIVLGDTGTTSGGTSGTINGTGSSGTLTVDVNAAFQNITAGQIILNASGNIYVGDGVVNPNGSFTPADGIIWDLTSSAGGIASGNLVLQAGGDISFVDGSLITDANSWDVTLKAGVNNFTTGAVTPKVGNIYLNGGPDGDGVGGSIQTAAGNINLEAGQDITLGTGYVITTGGGSITAHALDGNIDTGSDAQGYHFVSNAGSLSAAYTLNDNVGGISLGGISTAAGGDLTLIAGGDVRSFLPEGTIIDDSGTAGSGAYGRTQNGDVTIIAGGNVTGHYLVADGIGKIFAGVKMDANGNPLDINNNPVTDLTGNYVLALGGSGSAGTDLSSDGLALSLISGGWNVTAAQNILLQEVRNPNGDFNGGGTFKHYFDYTPGDYVNLSAGNLVQLGTTLSLPRLASVNGQTVNNVAVIYPSILNITAGAGGVILGTRTSPTSLTLFPSLLGSLTIDTLGSLVSAHNVVGAGPPLFNLIVSDADPTRPQYTTTHNFGIGDDASSPIHANAPTPIYLNIGGDMNYINLVVPEAAQINVGGSMINCGFQGMNVSAAPSFQIQIHEADGSTRAVAVDPSVTSIIVTGDIFNRGNFTSVDLSGIVGAQGLDLSDLARAITGPGDADSTTLTTSFFYDSATRTLTFEDIPNHSLASVLSQANDLILQQYINGVPQWQNPPDNTIPVPDTQHPVSVFGDPSDSSSVAYALLNQYRNLSALPYALPNNANTYGYTIGGGGQFNITAQMIDLGTSTGIQSEGVALYTVNGSYPLANLFGNGGVFAHGTDIAITTTGNHSAGVNPHTGDTAGDVDMFSSSIGSLGGGNVSINAGGDVNAGSAVLSVDPTALHGIYSTSGGDVSVIAGGDVNVNGSRIASYGGGDITVESLTGDVNVGNGASTPVAVTGYYEDPVTHVVYSDNVQLPFSGIVALTFPADPTYPAPALLGDILVEAPNGNITATAAGILQIPLNQQDYPDATTTVLAGYELNSSGVPVLALSDENIVTFGSTIDLRNLGLPILDASGKPVSSQQVSVTRLLDAGGAPAFDVLGNPLYVENLGLHGGSLITYSIAGGKITINPLLDPASNPVNIVGLADTSDSHGNPLFVYGRNINVNGSGIIAGNANLDASGDINGLIFARNNININAQQNVNVTAFGVGNVNVSSSSGTISGTLIGVGGVTASGSDVVASLISANVTGSTSGQSGLGQGNAAGATSQGLANNDTAQAAAASDQSADDEKKKKGKQVALAQKVSRVTVILPPKNMSENQTKTPGT